jgi:peptidoglycan hydrolase-like protein with peptidoglycan-binding domain
MRAANRIRRWRQVGLSSLLCLAVLGFAAAQTATASAKPAQSPAPSAKKHQASGHKSSTSAHKNAPKKKSRGRKGSKKRGQQAIDSTRTREIQEALIRQHYLQGKPSGTWDAETQAAMQRYQSDQGWQTKTIPDSRALIKLGLGPNHDHLLNPESAMTMRSADPPMLADPKAAANPASPEDNIPKQ